MNLDVYSLIAQRIAAANHRLNDLVFREAMDPATLARMVQARKQALSDRAFQMLGEVDRRKPRPLSFVFRADAALRARHWE